MPEIVILPTPTPPYKHFIPTPTPFVSVLATPQAPTEVGITEAAAGPRFDWALVAVVAVSVVVAALGRLTKRMR